MRLRRLNIGVCFRPCPKIFKSSLSHNYANMSRTPPAKAFEVLSLHLNFSAGSTVAINEVAKATGLAWATVQKYVTIMALVRKLAPDMDITEDGIRVGEASEAATSTMEDALDATVLYTFTHARKAGRPTGWVDLAHHTKLPPNLDLKQASLLEMIEVSGHRARLTSSGLAHANHLYRGLVERVPEVMALPDEPPVREVFVDDAPDSPRVYVSMHGQPVFGHPSSTTWARRAPWHAATPEHRVISK